jgi:hypothetical protein
MYQHYCYAMSLDAHTRKQPFWRPEIKHLTYLASLRSTVLFSPPVIQENLDLIQLIVAGQVSVVLV